MKKPIFIYIGMTAASLMLASNLTFADDANTTADAVNAFSAKFEAWAQANDNAKYAINQSLPALMGINNNLVFSDTQFNANLATANINSISNQLSKISDSALTYTSKYNEAVTNAIARKNADAKIIDNLTINLPASDTIYTAIPEVVDKGEADNLNISQPSQSRVKEGNAYLTISSLLNPVSYSPDQEKAAQGFITFLTKGYQSYADKINFQDLINSIQSNSTDSDGAEKSAQLISSVINSDDYKKFQLNARSSIASNSVALDNLNYLKLERTPIQTTQPNANLAALSEAIGVQPGTETITNPNNPSQTVKVNTYASPLAISNYVSNHRTASKQWYNRMQNASPATVQRETLYVLAEIESQMQQAHIDRDRLLAVMTATQLANSAISDNSTEAAAQKVNKLITKLTQPQSQDQDPNQAQPQNTQSDGSNTGQGSGQ